MKKGFTLIELLAVIVILAIIALIATPIVLNIINSSRKAATLESIKNYTHSAELAIASYSMSDGTVLPDDEYVMLQSDKKALKGKNSEKTLNIEYDGGEPTEASIVIRNGKIISVVAKQNKYKINFKDNNWTIGEITVSSSGKLYDLVKNESIDIGDEINYESPSDSTITWKILDVTSDGNVKIIDSSTKSLTPTVYGLPQFGSYAYNPENGTYYTRECSGSLGEQTCTDTDKTAEAQQLISNGSYVYLNIADLFNTDALKYADGTHAISGHALDLNDVVSVLGVTLVQSNSEHQVTGIFPGSSTSETRTVTDDYNMIQLSTKLDTSSKVYSLLNVESYLASTCVNISGPSMGEYYAYFNVYRIWKDWLEGLEVISTKTYNGFSVNPGGIQTIYRPVVVIDGTANVIKDSSGVWNFE